MLCKYIVTCVFQPAASAGTGALTRRRRATEAMSSWSIIEEMALCRGRFRGVLGAGLGDMDDARGIDDVENVLEAAMGISTSLVARWAYEGEEAGGIGLDTLCLVASAIDHA